MSVVVEKLEGNMANLKVTVEADKVDKALDEAYNKQKNKLSIPGFRKGKVPKHMIEKMYGPEVFYEDAMNILLREEYPVAAEESGLDIVSRPEIEVKSFKKGEEMLFEAKVAVKPEVTLGEYKGVKIAKVDATVTDAEVDEEIERERNANARTITVSDRAVEDGDIAVIDYEGFCDGEAFAGGKDEGHALTIGSHSFIDGFEDQIIGHNVGDEFDVNVTFPEEYHAAELAGKPAVFKVKVDEIRKRELPELSDLADDEGFDSVDEFRADVAEKLGNRKRDQAKRKREDAAVKAVIENSQMDIPEPMIEFQIDRMVDDFEARLSQQGLSFAQYIQFSGQTEEKLREQMKPDALARIQGSLVLEAIAKAEDIHATDAEVDAEIEDMAKAYGNMDVEQLKAVIGDGERESIANDLEIQKALEFLAANAIEE